MPKGPKGQKRPADVVSNAVLSMRILTGEAEEVTAPAPSTDHHSRGGKKGGAARASKLSPEQRAEIARKAAAKRWER